MQADNDDSPLDVEVRKAGTIWLQRGVWRATTLKAL